MESDHIPELPKACRVWSIIRTNTWFKEPSLIQSAWKICVSCYSGVGCMLSRGLAGSCVHNLPADSFLIHDTPDTPWVTLTVDPQGVPTSSLYWLFKVYPPRVCEVLSKVVVMDFTWTGPGQNVLCVLPEIGFKFCSQLQPSTLNIRPRLQPLM